MRSIIGILLIALVAASTADENGYEDDVVPESLMAHHDHPPAGGHHPPATGDHHPHEEHGDQGPPTPKCPDGKKETCEKACAEHAPPAFKKQCKHAQCKDGTCWLPGDGELTQSSSKTLFWRRRRSRRRRHHHKKHHHKHRAAILKLHFHGCIKKARACHARAAGLKKAAAHHAAKAAHHKKQAAHHHAKSKGKWWKFWRWYGRHKAAKAAKKHKAAHGHHAKKAASLNAAIKRHHKRCGAAFIKCMRHGKHELKFVKKKRAHKHKKVRRL